VGVHRDCPNLCGAPNTIEYNTIKTICNALKVDRLIESEARAVRRWAGGGVGVG